MRHRPSGERTDQPRASSVRSRAGIVRQISRGRANQATSDGSKRNVISTTCLPLSVSAGQRALDRLRRDIEHRRDLVGTEPEHVAQPQRCTLNAQAARAPRSHGVPARPPATSPGADPRRPAASRVWSRTTYDRRPHVRPRWVPTLARRGVVHHLARRAGVKTALPGVGVAATSEQPNVGDAGCGSVPGAVCRY
jgi:hypothetical protein